MMNKTLKNRVSPSKIGAYLGLAVLVLASFVGMPKAFASTMTQASVLETNMNASGTSTVFVDFKAGASDAAGTLTVNFNGFTVNAAQTVVNNTCSTVFAGATGLPTGTSLTAAGASTTVTVSNVSALTSGTQYCFQLNSATALTNPVAGTYNNVIITDASDTTTVGMDIISNDQISVTATVPPSFTLAFGGNSDSLGALSSSSLKVSSGITLTVNTNAASGWGLWAEDGNGATPGLKSVAASKTIASVSVASHTMNGGAIGTEAFALGVTTGNAVTNYADAGGITGGGLSGTAYNEIASATGPATNSTVTVKELADISGATPAAVDYGDTITIVGAGSF
jgi:hypothetical protein